MPMARVVSRIVVVAARVRQIRASKKTLAERLHEHESRLKGGVWWIIRENLARHASVNALPTSLQLTKNRRARDASFLVQWLRQLVFFTVPPFRVRVPGAAAKTAAEGGEFSILLQTRSGDLVAFDVARRSVARLGVMTRFNEEWLALRQRLGEALRLPSITHFRPGQIIVEDFAPGLPIDSVSTAQRVAALKTLLTQYQRLTRRYTAAPPEPEFWHHAVAVFRGLALPTAARQAFEALSPATVGGFQELGFCVAHGDLSAANVLVTPEGPTLIDVEDCAILPAFYDVFFLAHQEAVSGRDGVWQFVVVGEGFADIEQVLRERSGRDRAALWESWVWGSFIAECFAWARKIGSPPLTAELLQKWWAPLQATLIDSSSMDKSAGIACPAS